MKRSEVLYFAAAGALAGCSPIGMETKPRVSSRSITSRVSHGAKFPGSRPDGSFPAADHKMYRFKKVLNYSSDQWSTAMIVQPSGSDTCTPGGGGTSPDTTASMGSVVAYGWNSQNYIEYWDAPSTTLIGQGYFSAPASGRCGYTLVGADGTSATTAPPAPEWVPC